MSNYVVCPACEGEGKDLSRAIVLTGEDLDLYAGDSYEDRMDYVRDCAAATPLCDLCRGQRVVDAQDATNWHEDAELRWEQMRESQMLGEW